MNIRNTEHFGIQRKIVAAMTTDSWQNIPHVSYMYEPDVTAFYKEFKKINISLNNTSTTKNRNKFLSLACLVSEASETHKINPF